MMDQALQRASVVTDPKNPQLVKLTSGGSSVGIGVVLSQSYEMFFNKLDIAGKYCISYIICL